MIFWIKFGESKELTGDKEGDNQYRLFEEYPKDIPNVISNLIRKEFNHRVINSINMF